MGTGLERAGWPGPALTEDLFELACRERPATPSTDQIVAWVGERLGSGTTPEQLCEAALWLGLRYTRVEGRGPAGLVSHVVLGAHASAAIGDSDPSTAVMAATQLVAYAVGDRHGGVNDDPRGTHRAAVVRARVPERQPRAGLPRRGARR